MSVVLCHVARCLKSRAKTLSLVRSFNLLLPVTLDNPLSRVWIKNILTSSTLFNPLFDQLEEGLVALVFVQDQGSNKELIYFWIIAPFHSNAITCIAWSTKPNKWRSQMKRDYPLNLSILLSGGKETNKDSPSNGEWSGKSSKWKSGRQAPIRIVS